MPQISRFAVKGHEIFKANNVVGFSPYSSVLRALGLRPSAFAKAGNVPLWESKQKWSLYPRVLGAGITESPVQASVPALPLSSSDLDKQS